MSGWITGLVEAHGWFAVAVLMLAENIIVFIPSELIMPLAGYFSTAGHDSVWIMILAGTIGANLGSFGWYVVGRKIPQKKLRHFVQRHGAWLAMEPKHLDKAQKWFDRHGGLAVLTGRLIPAIRTFISIPAGFSKMSFLPFAFYSFVGTFAFNTALAWGGRLLGEHFKKIHDYVQPITWAVIGLLFI
ncbi:MAG: DedA family protein, partial [Thermoanaerobaculia bacterium]